MRRLLLPALLAALLPGGCGGAEPPEKAAYERGFNAARQAFTDRVKALERPPDDAPAAVRAAAGKRAAEEMSRFVGELEALDPPADVARAHRDLTAAFRESAQLTAQAARELRSGNDQALRQIARRLSDRSPIDRRAEAAVQVLVEKDYVLDLDFDLGR